MLRAFNENKRPVCSWWPEMETKAKHFHGLECWTRFHSISLCSVRNLQLFCSTKVEYSMELANLSLSWSEPTYWFPISISCEYPGQSRSLLLMGIKNDLRNLILKITFQLAVMCSWLQPLEKTQSQLAFSLQNPLSATSHFIECDGHFGLYYFFHSSSSASSPSSSSSNYFAEMNRRSLAGLSAEKKKPQFLVFCC